MKNLVAYGLFLNVLLLTFFSDASAQSASIEGKVYEDGVQRPLPGANVVVKEVNLGSTTDTFGKFKFSNLKPGNYTLVISFIGFETEEVGVDVSGDKPSEVSVNLEASTLELSEITISPGSRLNSKNSISSVDIRLRPINNSQKVLDFIPGLFTAQHAGGGKAEQIFLRGFDIDHGTDINLSLDGMPVNMVSHAHGQGYSDLHFIIPETISRVDFNKGPYYSNKGNFTTAGYAAYQTKSSIDRSSIKVEGGQFNTLRSVTMLDLLGSNKSHNAYVATEYKMSDGYFDSSQNFNRMNIFAKYNNYLSDDKLLTASLSTFSSSWDASGQIPERAVDEGIINRFGAIDDTEGGETSRTNLNLKLINSLNSDALLTNQIYFIRYDFDLYSNFTFFLNDPVNGDQIRQQESRSVYGYDGSYKTDLYLGNTKFLTEIGAGFRYDDINDISLSHTMNRNTVLRRLAMGQIDEVNVDAYIDETIQLTPKFAVNTGIRFDHHRFIYVDELESEFNRRLETKNVVSPKLNLNYTFNSSTELYLKSGIGYHSNDTRVVIAQDGKKILPKAFGVDFGTNIKPFDRLLINGAVWLLELEQEFIYVGDEAVVEPGGRTQRMGFDLSARYQLTGWLFADTDFNFTRARLLNAPAGENYIPLAPSLTSRGGLMFKALNGFNGSFRYRFIDKRPADEAYTVTAEGFFLLDAVLEYKNDNYQVGFSVENLLNNEWKEAQFNTESRLRNEPEPVSEIHYTPGSPLFLKGSFTYFF